MCISRMCRTAFAVCCAFVGALALWRLTITPEAAGTWEAMVLVGGWGLGLVPIQAVPYERRMTWRRLRTDWWPPAPERASRTRGRAPYPPAPGSSWQRGHQ